MEIRFRDARLAALEVPPGDGGFPVGVARAYRQRLNLIRAAEDERVFYGMKSLHYEKLKGNRQHQRSMRLNLMWRLILEIEAQEGTGAPVVVIVAIEDYH